MDSVEEGAPDQQHKNLENYTHRTLVKRGVERLDRRPASGLAGGPKKGGHGGKFTWAGPTPEEDLEPVIAALDENDPNYVDDEPADEEVLVAGKMLLNPLEMDLPGKQPVEKVVVEGTP